MLPIVQNGPITKVAEGEIGGKARSLPFLHRLIEGGGLLREFAPHEILVPETWVLSTGIFDRFVQRNHLEACLDLDDDDEIRRRFLRGSFDGEVEETLADYLETHREPLAVRSSSASEDAYRHPAAGMFQTIFLPNREPGRHRQLLQAVKLVFASALYRTVSHYLRAHGVPREDEKMAVALEAVVGHTYGRFHYPLLSGVAQSVNFFPVAAMRPEHGVAIIVVGLGRRVVAGLDGMRFCPRFPTLRPERPGAQDLLRLSQQAFDAVDLDTAGRELTGADGDTLTTLPIETGDEHGTLRDVAATVDLESGVLYEGMLADGPRVVTFDRFLRESLFPLPRVLSRVVALVSDGFGSAVEIEFAFRFGHGANSRRGQFYLLQARPMASLELSQAVTIPDLRAAQVVLRTSMAMGHGAVDGLRHVVFVDPEEFRLDRSPQMAAEVGELNERLAAGREPYALLGPGRWGTCNAAVGIPVSYAQVDGARLIAELTAPSLRAQPSQGTHFFHNVVAGSLFYLMIEPARGDVVDLEWLRAQPNRAATRFARLITIDPGLAIRVQGQERVGVVYRPTAGRRPGPGAAASRPIGSRRVQAAESP
ncbi:MAG: hypothetical protein HY906_24730, partial [Deltaproteobacteria bacterium]|nr:hypothetical protein [Deltaproteobacteria bacterium]